MSQPAKSRKHPGRAIVLIPAFQPGASLLEVVRALSADSPVAIIVVDDGSGSAFSEVFDRVGNLPRVTVLRHSRNLGKGAALKTGIGHVLQTYPHTPGVVTADADGQHHPEDILKMCRRLGESPQFLTMGVRGFEGRIPFRSRLGNEITRRVMRVVLGRNLSDTQSGLRAIPRPLMEQLLTVPATGYEFELAMLVAAKHLGVPVVEQSIRTIYEPHNPSSHFHPLRDSMRIYFVLLRFSLVSVLSAALDNLLFFVAIQGGASLLAAQIAARVVSVFFNYSSVRKAAFHSGEGHRVVLPRYLALVGTNVVLSYAGIRWLTHAFPLNLFAAKALAETLLFFVNFLIQRDLIFTRRGRRERVRPTKVPSRIAPAGLRWNRPRFKETAG